MDNDKEKEKVKNKGFIKTLFSPKVWRDRLNKIGAADAENTGAPAKTTNSATDEGDPAQSTLDAPISKEEEKEISSISANKTPVKLWPVTLKRQWSSDKKKKRKKEDKEESTTLRKDETIAAAKETELQSGNEDISNAKPKTEFEEVNTNDAKIKEEALISEDETIQGIDEAHDFNAFATRRNLEKDAKEMEDPPKRRFKFSVELDAECERVMKDFDKITEDQKASVELSEVEETVGIISQELIDQQVDLLLGDSIEGEEMSEIDSDQDLTSLAAEFESFVIGRAQVSKAELDEGEIGDVEEIIQNPGNNRENIKTDEVNSACEEDQDEAESEDSNEDSMKTEEPANASVQYARLLAKIGLRQSQLNEKHIFDNTLFLQDNIHVQNTKNKNQKNITDELNITNENNQIVEKLEAVNQAPSRLEKMRDNGSIQDDTNMKTELIDEERNVDEIAQDNQCNQNLESKNENKIDEVTSACQEHHAEEKSEDLKGDSTKAEVDTKESVEDNQDFETKEETVAAGGVNSTHKIKQDRKDLEDSEGDLAEVDDRTDISSHQDVASSEADTFSRRRSQLNEEHLVDDANTNELVQDNLHHQNLENKEKIDLADQVKIANEVKQDEEQQRILRESSQSFVTHTVLYDTALDENPELKEKQIVDNADELVDDNLCDQNLQSNEENRTTDEANGTYQDKQAKEQSADLKEVETKLNGKQIVDGIEECIKDNQHSQNPEENRGADGVNSILGENENKNESEDSKDIRKAMENVLEQFEKPAIVDGRKLVQDNQNNEDRGNKRDTISMTAEPKSTQKEDQKQLEASERDLANIEEKTGRESTQDVSSLEVKVDSKQLKFEYVMRLIDDHLWIQTESEINNPFRPIFWEYVKADVVKPNDKKSSETQCVQQKQQENLTHAETSCDKATSESVSTEEESEEEILKEDPRRKRYLAEKPEAICLMTEEELDEVMNHRTDYLPDMIKEENEPCQVKVAIEVFENIRQVSAEGHEKFVKEESEKLSKERLFYKGMNVFSEAIMDQSQGEGAVNEKEATEKTTGELDRVIENGDEIENQHIEKHNGLWYVPPNDEIDKKLDEEQKERNKKEIRRLVFDFFSQM